MSYKLLIINTKNNINKISASCGVLLWVRFGNSFGGGK